MSLGICGSATPFLKLPNVIARNTLRQRSNRQEIELAHLTGDCFGTPPSVRRREEYLAVTPCRACKKARQFQRALTKVSRLMLTRPWPTSVRGFSKFFKGGFWTGPGAFLPLRANDFIMLPEAASGYPVGRVGRRAIGTAQVSDGTPERVNQHVISTASTKSWRRQMP